MNPGVKFLDLFNLKNILETTLETEWKRQLSKERFFEKKIPKVFIDGENTVAMLNMNQLKGHTGRAFHGIFVSASGAKTTVAAERDKFKISARRA